MKKNSLATSIVLLAFSAALVLADDQTSVPQTRNFQKGTELLGMDVRNPSGEKLGNINDVVLDLPSGRVAFCVLASGGILGIGDKLLALPPMTLKISPGRTHLVLNSEKEFLRQAPSFDWNHWPEVANASFTNEVYRYHLATYPKMRQIEAAHIVKNNTAKAPPREGWKPGYRNPNAGIVPGGIIEEAAGAERNEELKFSRASQFVGASVRNGQGEKLGTIRDVAVDLASGRILYAVLASGGFLGVGEKLFAIPTGALKHTGEERTLLLHASKDLLKSTPGFEPNRWPEAANETFAASLQKETPTLEQRVIQEPAGLEKPRSIPIRPAVAKRQPVNSDFELTQKITGAIANDPEVSLSAKTVLITTANGKVTVRGSARSPEEKHAILSKAREMAGFGNVEDQIEVKR
jgi:sporulation protein YlmC with PRC-barrel domain